MPAQAIANTVELADSLPDAAPKRRISARMRQVIDLLFTGACTTQKAAAERAGLNPEHVCRMLKEPQVRALIERRARDTVQTGVMRASARLNELLDAESEHVSLDATKHVLGIAGIKPIADPQLNVSIELKAGYVIDLTGEHAVGRHAGNKPPLEITPAIQPVSEDDASS